MDETSKDSVELIVSSVRGRPLAMINVARTLLAPKGMIERARALAEEAVALAPDDPEVFARAGLLRSHGIGDWYWTMVQDEPRHELYAQAFRQLFTPGCTVLDIGAGTGLFAMLAAREGAGRVIACERNPAVAEAARRIVALNGYADRVSIINKDSKDLQIGVDLDEPADVLLWDNLANNVLGAGAADTLADARRRLIKPGAAIIPARAEIVVALVDDKRPQDRVMTVVSGFDMSPFNDFMATNFTLKPHRHPRLSDAAVIFDLDFTDPTPLRPQTNTVTVTANQDGVAHGVAQWVRFHLTDKIVYDTSGDTVTAFGMQLHTLPAFSLKATETLTICGHHDCRATWFWVER